MSDKDRTKEERGQDLGKEEKNQKKGSNIVISLSICCITSVN